MSIAAKAAEYSAEVEKTSRPVPAHVARQGARAMRLPNFLVIGAGRSGTTTLHYSLGRHPQIFVSPIKETNFFLCDEAGELPPWLDEVGRRQVPRTLQDYAALFADAAAHHIALGEASPSYLHEPVASRIKARLPDVKLVAILRQPAEQALSFYATTHDGRTPPADHLDEFVAALASDAPGPGGALPLAKLGLYHRHLTSFFEHFDRRQIKVTLLDDLERDGVVFFRDLFRFLGVDEGFRLDTVERYNGSGIARSAAIHRLLSCGARVKGLARAVLPDAAFRRLATLQHGVRAANLQRTSPLPPGLRRELTRRFYGEDIAALEQLIGRDLSIWTD
jgi:Sulfotransferase family